MLKNVKVVGLEIYKDLLIISLSYVIFKIVGYVRGQVIVPRGTRVLTG